MGLAHQKPKKGLELGGCTIARGGATGCADFSRGVSPSRAIGKEDARGIAGRQVPNGKSTYNKTDSSLPTNSGVQSIFSHHQNGDGGSGVQCYLHAREGSLNGYVEEDEMDLEGGRENSASLR